MKRTLLLTIIFSSQLITSMVQALPMQKQHGHFFRMFDTDGNQQVDKDEFINARNQRFQSMDADANGIVSQKEFAAYAKTRHQHYKMSKHKAMDANQDGSVSKQEYIDAKLKRANKHFAKLDKNNDGLLSAEESAHHKPFKRKKGNHFFKKMDANDDGEISLKESQQVTDRWFSKLDLNKDQSITREEIKAMHRQFKEHK